MDATVLINYEEDQPRYFVTFQSIDDAVAKDGHDPAQMFQTASEAEAWKAVDLINGTPGKHADVYGKK
jgi:hypothetical protein